MRFPSVQFETSTAQHRTGRSSRDLSRAYAAGRLVRPRRGVYLPTDEWLSGTAADRYAITTASLAAAGPSPVLCRETALMAWGVEFARTPTHVRYRTTSRARSGSTRPAGIYGNESVALKAWTASRRGQMLPQGYPEAKHWWEPVSANRLTVPHLGLSLAMEPFDAAFADTIHRLPFTEAVVVVDALLAGRDGLKVRRTAGQLRALQASLPTASARARTGGVLDFADAGSESVGESFSRALMWELGFEMPQLQVSITRDGRWIARADFCWPKLKLVGEFDGLQKYLRSRKLSGKSAAEAVVAEKLREDEIRAAGYGVVRWIWDDLLEPTRLAAALHRAGVPRRWTR